MVDELTSRAFVFDHNLLHDAGVVAFLVAGLTAFPLWAVLGVGATLRWRPALVAIVALVWFPVSIVGGFLSAGVASGILPLYSNLGLAQLTLRFPWAAAIVTLVLALWAVGFYLIGRAARRRTPQMASAQDVHH